MKTLISLCLISASLSAFAYGWNDPDQLSRKDINYLMNETELVNRAEVIENLKLIKDKKYLGKGFSTPDPYNPRHTNTDGTGLSSIMIEGIQINNHKLLKDGNIQFYHQTAVHNWKTLSNNNRVCAYKFLDNKQYKLKTFESFEDAQMAGYTVTHKNHCGTCSNLHDLGAYLKTRDITEPARKCTKKLTLAGIKKCYMEKIDFSPACAETWAYNSKNTRAACIGVCIKEYGLINLILNKFPEDYGSEDKLKPCIYCDEVRSVPGYNYGAGRTRRNSGIVSGILRDAKYLYKKINYSKLKDFINGIFK
jgi:hypothetical protein